MKNREFLDLCYKFFNRFITSGEFLDLLEKLDLSIFSNDDKDSFIDFKTHIRDMVETIPNEIDDYVKNEKDKIKSVIGRLEQIPKDEEFEQLNNHVESLKKSYDKELDSHDKWFKIVEFIDENDFFNKSFDSLNDYELLEFITQYICTPLPPQLEQNRFDDLIRVGIENDEREWIWRMAVNYQYSGLNFDLIIDYFIEVKDSYYLSELMFALFDTLDIDSLIDKIKDDDLKKDMLEQKKFYETDYIKEH